MLLFLTQMVFFGEIYVFLPIRSTYLFEINRDYVNFETPNLKEVLLSQRETMFLKLLLLTQMVVCGEKGVFPQLS
jgi:hypothetical protein